MENTSYQVIYGRKNKKEVEEKSPEKSPVKRVTRNDVNLNELPMGRKKPVEHSPAIVSRNDKISKVNKEPSNKLSNKELKKEEKASDSLREINQSYNQKDFNFNFSEISENKSQFQIQASKTKVNQNRTQRFDIIHNRNEVNVKQIRSNELKAGEESTSTINSIYQTRNKISNADQLHRFINKAERV